MFKAKVSFISLIAIALVFSSCKDDENYVPISIQAIAESVEVQQDNSIEIDVLANDINIPSNGLLSVSGFQNGSAIVLDSNNTPDNPSDDVIQYTPNTNFYGQDTFSYSICNALFPFGCGTALVTVTVTPISPVNFEIDQVPYQTLSEYNFFEGNLANLNPVYGVLPYDLNSPLFSDYAHKKRFIWMPSDVRATYNNDYTPLNFPTGSILIKNFYYDNVLPNNETKLIETRLMIRMAGEWIFAKYVWNDEQTEAFFTNDGSFVEIDWTEDNQTKSVNYRVPSISECFTCHNKFGTPVPIGPKPQNLNKEYVYSDGIQNQLSKWVTQGYLDSNYPSEITSTIAWDDLSQPLDLRARSYIDINCAHCHSEQSYCEYRPMRFGFDQNDESVNMGVCVEPDTQIDATIPFIITPGSAERSVVFFRLNTTLEQYRMPLFGRSLKHIEGVRLIEEWINSLEVTCE